MKVRFPNPIISEDARRILANHSDRLVELQGATVLVTGASGFLCSYLVDILVAWNNIWDGPPVQIIALDNFIAGSRDRLAHLSGEASVVFMAHDATTPFPVEERIDYIIHGASIASPLYYRQYPLETIDVNVNGTTRMLTLAREHKVKSAVFLSSSEIYGDPEPQFIPTDKSYRGSVSCTGPRACYGQIQTAWRNSVRHLLPTLSNTSENHSTFQCLRSGPTAQRSTHRA